MENTVDFNFIYENVKLLYLNTMRPSIDPVVLVKMLLPDYPSKEEQEKIIKHLDDKCISIDKVMQK